MPSAKKDPQVAETGIQAGRTDDSVIISVKGVSCSLQVGLDAREAAVFAHHLLKLVAELDGAKS